jgi:hypothetical protein
MTARYPTDSADARDLREAQRETDDLAELLAQCLAARPAGKPTDTWTRQSLATAICQATGIGIPADEIGPLLVQLARHPDVVSPNAIRKPGLVAAAKDAERRQAIAADRATWMPHCNECDVNRQITRPDGTQARCPHCHPLVTRRKDAA